MRNQPPQNYDVEINHSNILKITLIHKFSWYTHCHTQMRKFQKLRKKHLVFLILLQFYSQGED